LGIYGGKLALGGGPHHVDDKAVAGLKLGQHHAEGFSNEAAAAVALDGFARLARGGYAQARGRQGTIHRLFFEHKDVQQGAAIGSALVIYAQKIRPLEQAVFFPKKKAARGRFFFTLKFCHGQSHGAA